MADGVSWGQPPGAAPGPAPADDYFSIGPPLPPQASAAGAPGGISTVNTDSDSGGDEHPGRRRAVRPLVIAAIAVGVLTLIGVSVSAAQGGPSSSPAGSTASSTPSSAPTSGPREGFRGHGFGPGGPAWAGGLAGAGGGVVHGEFVRRNGNGYQTVDVQVGQVTAVSSSSITVQSSDQFTKTYSVTTNTLVNAGRDGIGTVKVNHNVSVQAVVNGTGAEASNIVDQTTLGNLRQHWRPAPPPSASSPSPSSPSTSTP